MRPVLRAPLAVLLLCLASIQAFADPAPNRVRKPFTRVTDREAFRKETRARGFRAKGGVEQSKTASAEYRTRSFPFFTSSFTSGGVTYPFTMVGTPPSSGRATSIKTVIVPLRMKFVYFDQDVSFDPAVAVQNILASPIYNEARFANGVGQFGDQLQRATFWNKMDRRRNWHVRLDAPRVLPTIDVLVEPDVGEIFQVGPGPADLLGNVRFGMMDSTLHTVLQLIELAPDEVPIFVTGNVFADALGYHDAFSASNPDGSETLRTLMYTSWLDEALVGDLLADVSTLNHEVAEWLNDPFINNVVPLWAFPPFNAVCGDNNLLEVGDPQGNGPDYALFPTVPVRLNGFTYHLQDIAMVPWFTGETPSSSFNGWYDFPAGDQLTAPARPCP
jgi:hypothetical protein